MKFKFLSMLSVLAMLLSACGSGQPKTATATPNTVLTSVALTVQARLENPPETSTPQPAPSATAPLTTPTAATSPTLAATTAAPSPTLPSVTTPVAGTADQAKWMADLTFPDGTAVSAGQALVKTWRVKNVGSTTWTTAYTLVKISNDGFGGPTSVNLPNSVAPGDTIDISVQITAPNANGKATSTWKLANASGQQFNEYIYVQVVVGGSVSTPVAGTPIATTTPGSTTGLITALAFSVDDSQVSDTCPYAFTFRANLTLSKAATLVYKLEAGSNDPSFTFDLPPAQTSTFPAGTYSLEFRLNIKSSGSGFVKFHITSPQDITSNSAVFTLTCKK